MTPKIVETRRSVVTKIAMMIKFLQSHTNEILERENFRYNTIILEK